MCQFDFDLFLHCDVLLALITIVSDRWSVVLNSIVGGSKVQYVQHQFGNESLMRRCTQYCCQVATLSCVRQTPHTYQLC